MCRQVRLHRSLFLRRESAFLRQHRDWDSVFVQVAFGNHDEILTSISGLQTMRSASIATGNHSQRLSRLAELQRVMATIPSGSDAQNS